MTDSEYYHQRANKPGPNVGKVMVEENLTTRIGGLARIRDRLGHHERAAEDFKNGYEQMYGNGAPAADAGRTQVDTSPIAHDSGMAAKMDRGVKISRAIEGLGKDRANLVIAVIVLCIPIKEIARTPHSRDCKSTTAELMQALDILAQRWGYLTAHSKAS
ncbi:hypothetical protein [Pelagibacterium luteolum]|nr:hypothetical protein [Pelagibacterium luteolum]